MKLNKYLVFADWYFLNEMKALLLLVFLLKQKAKKMFLLKTKPSQFHNNKNQEKYV